MQTGTGCGEKLSVLVHATGKDNNRSTVDLEEHSPMTGMHLYCCMSHHCILCGVCVCEFLSQRNYSRVPWKVSESKPLLLLRIFHTKVPTAGW